MSHFHHVARHLCNTVLGSVNRQSKLLHEAFGKLAKLEWIVETVLLRRRLKRKHTTRCINAACMGNLLANCYPRWQSGTAYHDDSRVAKNCNSDKSPRASACGSAAKRTCTGLENINAKCLGSSGRWSTLIIWIIYIK